MDTVNNINKTIDLLHASSCYYVHRLDNEARYTYVNKRFADSFNFIAEDLIGQPFHVTMHPDDIRICEEVGMKCYANPGQLFPAVIRKVDRDGKYYVTQWEFTLIVEEGQPLGIFCIGYDITEYARVKKEISAINLDLTSKNELLEAIAFEQSHIVRGPLANIMGLINVLKGYSLDHGASAIVAMLEESSNQLDEVVKSIVKKTNG